MVFDLLHKNKAIRLRDSLNNLDINKAKEFLENNASQSWIDDFRLLYDMITDSRYKISGYTKSLIIGTLAYFVMPIDVISDFIPVVGWIDDMFVLSLTMKSIQDEIENYKTYKGIK
jgi:uncharacterized membrane protein YkvA (DUF1232 family)